MPTSCEKSVFGEDGNRVDEEHRDCTVSAEMTCDLIISKVPWNSPPKLKKRVAIVANQHIWRLLRVATLLGVKRELFGKM